MINATDQPIVISRGNKLHASIIEAIETAIALLERQLKRPPAIDDIADYGFYRLLGKHNHKPRVRFDAAFVSACFNVSQGDSQSTDDRGGRDALAAYLKAGALPAHGLSALRRGLKLMLVELWRNRVLLLPTTFTVSPRFPTDMFEHSLLVWLRGFDPNEKSKGGGATDTRRLYYYGPRLLWATDWLMPSDISLSDLATLNRASLLYQRQLATTVIAGGTQLPFTLFATKALAQFPGQVPFTEDQIKAYSRWVLSSAYQSQSFDEYLAAPPVKALKKPSAKDGARLPTTGRRLDYIEPDEQGGVHEALRVNFKRLQKGHRLAADWLVHDLPSYKSREHVDLREVAPKWIDAFRAYMHHRTHVKGLRSSTEATAALNVLADYLFFYLPWWRELAQSPQVGLPCTPKQLSRFAFVSRHTSESLDEFPETLLTVIGWRRTTKESIAVAVHQLALFFEFVETHFSDNESMAGSNFRSPLNPDFDAPRAPSRSKTTKEVIPKNIYGHLLFYAYAVEDVGMKLERLAKEGRLPYGSKALRNARWLRLSDFGITASVRHRFAEHPLEVVPNVFQWVERQFANTADRVAEPVLVPHCSIVRLLTASIETGLRCQSIQWLDRQSWRSKCDSWSSESYVVPLFVNTDKTKTEPWVSYMVHRVRAMLAREEAFQGQFTDANAFPSVYYEGNPNSPFDVIEPLFRSPASAVPVSDDLYQDYWRLLMVGFEAFFREVTGERHIRLYKLQPVRSADDTPVVQATKNKDANLFCPLSLLAIHTPHACRATFATNRKGILELADAAELLGHSSTLVTAHYDKPSMEDLVERLKASDEALCQDFLQFEAESDVHVRADRSDSALVKSFTNNRAATVKTFGFMPSLTVWSTEDGAEDPEGLRLLQEGPMSRIRFRETHICPVGEECPVEVIERIGEPRRCGCCPLAMRCVDHLPAIAAKRNQILERIRFVHGRFEALKAQGEPAAVLDELWDTMEMDANEYLGWQLSEEVLNGTPAALPGIDASELHVEQPEVVKRHLQRVSRSGGMAELMLQRIADSNAYPSLATPQVQLVASQVKRRLLTGKGLDAIDWSDDGAGAIKEVATMLSVMMKTAGVSREQLARALSGPPVTEAAWLLNRGVDER